MADSHLYSIGALDVTDRYGDHVIESRLRRFAEAFKEIGPAKLKIIPFNHAGHDRFTISLEGYDPKLDDRAAVLLTNLSKALTADYDFTRGATPTRGRFIEAAAKSFIVAGRQFGPQKW